MTTQTTRDSALQGLEKRRFGALQTKQINNADLYAGSPMYFYCKLCNGLAATLPESYTERPPRYCRECDVDMKNQLLSTSD